ncbi:unnamed protein product [Amoebophrya sp. A25]|nr:unnamed protein product [Amoebophrya sp. A25]|eukprot:GSA25T00027031001.1
MTKSVTSLIMTVVLSVFCITIGIIGLMRLLSTTRLINALLAANTAVPLAAAGAVPVRTWWTSTIAVIDLFGRAAELKQQEVIMQLFGGAQVQVQQEAAPERFIDAFLQRFPDWKNPVPSVGPVVLCETFTLIAAVLCPTYLLWTYFKLPNKARVAGAHEHDYLVDASYP